MDSKIADVREQIVVIGALMYARRLTDSAGGNISVRVGDRICITPRYAGSQFRWQLKPEQVVVADMDGNKLEGDGEISRESAAHFLAFKTFPEVGAVVHGHAEHILVFASLAQPMPPVLECTRKFGEIQVVDYAPAHSMDLAQNLIGKLQGQEARIRKQAAALISPYHGLFAFGRDLDAAYDTLERLDINAFVLLNDHAYSGKTGADISSRMEEGIAAYFPGSGEIRPAPAGGAEK
ncbi:MAG: class II aldolase/adducin family protein [Anaerolineales bacterium]|nr:class II aldolase/adducin family protein [Anaerolineales bacterium]